MFFLLSPYNIGPRNPSYLLPTHIYICLELATSIIGRRQEQFIHNWWRYIRIEVFTTNHLRSPMSQRGNQSSSSYSSKWNQVSFHVSRPRKFDLRGLGIGNWRRRRGRRERGFPKFCRCGEEAVIKTSRTENNPGRLFHCCPYGSEEVTTVVYFIFIVPHISS